MGTSSETTISVTNERRTGLSNASRTPPTAATPYRAPRFGWGWKARAASTNDWAISPIWVTVSRRFLSTRSATRPANGEKSRIGPNWQAVSRPTARPLEVRLSTSSVSATMVSQLPVLEMSWPMKNSR